MSAALALTGVTVVDVRDGSLEGGMTIVARDGKIAQIAPAAHADTTGVATSVDASGKFVVPGYLDLHAHPLNAADPNGSLTLMLASGITGFRQLSGTPETLAARRAGTLMPNIPAPELLEMPGLILTGPNVRTPEIAVAEVRSQVEQGADFIKIIDYGADVFFAVAAECKRLGIRFLGHLSPAVDVREAAGAGMRSIEHLGPRDAVLIGYSSEEAEMRRLVAQMPPKGAPISGPIPENVIRRALANPALLTDPAEIARYDRVIATFSEAKLRDLAEHFVAAGTWHTPTLIRVRTQMYADDPAYHTDPHLRYVPPAQREMWQELGAQFVAKLPPSACETLKRLFETQTKLVRPLKDAGVKMMAGSDSGGSAGWNIPGFSLHQEFDLLAQAGLSALEILQMATLNGAEFLGRESSMGSVAAGKDANLVLLDANPVADVQHLHAPAGIVRAGTYYAAHDLAAMKQRIEDGLATLTLKPTGPPCC